MTSPKQRLAENDSSFAEMLRDIGRAKSHLVDSSRGSIGEFHAAQIAVVRAGHSHLVTVGELAWIERVTKLEARLDAMAEALKLTIDPEPCAYGARGTSCSTHGQSYPCVFDIARLALRESGYEEEK